MYAIVDCNNFFVSCETVFNPSLKGKPVVVLSNNDGCVISRSQQAKDAGIKMGLPAYQINDDKTVLYSSNYVLYGDMSRRVMSVLADSMPNIHVYSIDEAFVDFSGFEASRIEAECRSVIKKIRKYTGIPVSIGVAPNMTLAKLANRFAKRYKGYGGYCAIDDDVKRLKALELSKIEDVWGVGRRYSAFLKRQGIVTAADFTRQSAACIKHYMKLPGLRTYRELYGEQVIEPRKYVANKSVCVSRSFAKGVADMQAMEEAVSNFASSCAAKLRRQRSVATCITVFIMTNFYDSRSEKYYNSVTVTMPQPSNNTVEIVQTALRALSLVFRDGYSYRKAGVIATEISSDRYVQQNLFHEADNDRMESINRLLDNLNSKYGKKMLRLAVEGGVNEERNEGWRTRREHLSKNFTTDIREIIEVKA